MTRHIIDEKRELDGSQRAAKFLKIERDAAPHEASKALQKRPKHTGSGRLREFTRIEREQRG